jgi:hypothetical protein
MPDERQLNAKFDCASNLPLMPDAISGVWELQSPTLCVNEVPDELKVDSAFQPTDVRSKTPNSLLLYRARFRPSSSCFQMFLIITVFLGIYIALLFSGHTQIGTYQLPCHGIFAETRLFDRIIPASWYTSDQMSIETASIATTRQGSPIGRTNEPADSDKKHDTNQREDPLPRLGGFVLWL